MEKCKFCEAELTEGSTICPSCGKDNQEPQKAKLSVGKSVLAVAAVVAVAILLVGVLTVENKPVAVAEEVAAATIEVEETVAEETEPATIPADGNPDDVTCKGTYYADADAVVAARDTVIATAGDRELTLGQLQIFYWMEVRNFLSQYGAYAAYFGLDYQQSLDVQPFEMGDETMTWHQYFLDSALGAWASYGAMAAEADAAGYQLSEAQTATLAAIEEELNAAAAQNGFESGLDMLKSSMGAGAEIEDYAKFMELYFKANGYYAQLCEGFQPTDEEMDAFFEEHADGYAQSGITKDSKYVDVRHILVFPEGAQTAEEVSEEAWTAAEAAAQALLDEWMAGDKTEESFAALANEHSEDPGSNTNGGLYQDVTVGQMVQSFNDWCFDAERQIGDTGIVRTEYGFHVMFFSGSRPMWVEYVESDYVAEKANAMTQEIASRNPLTVKYADIALCNVELN